MVLVSPKRSQHVSASNSPDSRRPTWTWEYQCAFWIPQSILNHHIIQYIYILWIHMIQYDTLWYRIHRRFLVSAPGKWRLHARTPTISRGRPEQKPSHGSHGRIKQSDKSWYVGDSQISSRSGMKDLCTVLMSLFFADTPSWFPSMMKNVSKAARSPPLSVLPDQINQIADWHVTSGSFLILSDLFWSLCDYLSFRCFRFKHLCRAWQSSCQVSMERSGALQGPE